MAVNIKSCSPSVEQNEYPVGLKRLKLIDGISVPHAFIYEEGEGKDKVQESPGARNPTLEEAEKIHNGDSKFSLVQDGLKAAGSQGLCYEADEKEIKIFAYAKKVNRGDFLALYNKCKGVAGLPFDMHPDEVKGLASLQVPRLGKGSICCMESFCPTLDASTQKYEKGSYLFASNYPLLKKLTKIVKDKDVKIEGMTDDRRKVLAAYLGELTAAQDSSSWWQKAGVIASILSIPALAAIFLWIQKRNEKAMKEMSSANTNIDGSKITLKNVSDDPIATQRSELDSRGVFEQPYNDVDGKVVEIVDIVFRQQNDQKNYFSAGPSRSGKTATSRRGIPQAIIISQMTDSERAEYFKHATASMSSEEAVTYVEGMRSAADLISRKLQEGGYKGIMIVDIGVGKLKAAGAVWKGKEDKVIDLITEELLKLAEDGYKVIVFLDEAQTMEEGSLLEGQMALRQKIKELAEKHKNISVGIATTVDEAAQSVARDKATTNRYAVVFHEAPSPDKVVAILKNKPFVEERYKVGSIEPLAMKAIYLLGQRVDMRAATMAAVGGFFEEVLQAAKDRGVSNVSFEFVLGHYERRHSAKLGQSFLTTENIDGIFADEASEVVLQNDRDSKKLRTVVEEAGGQTRVGKTWWDRLAQGGLNADAGASPETQIGDVVSKIMKMQDLRQSFEVLDEPARRGVAEIIHGQWQEVERAGGAGSFRGADALTGRPSRGVPESFIRLAVHEMTKAAKAGGMTLAEGAGEVPVEAARAEATRALGLEALVGAVQEGGAEGVVTRITDAARRTGGAERGDGERVGAEGGVDADEAVRRANEAAKEAGKAAETVREVGGRVKAAATRK